MQPIDWGGNVVSFLDGNASVTACLADWRHGLGHSRRQVEYMKELGIMYWPGRLLNGIIEFQSCKRHCCLPHPLTLPGTLSFSPQISLLSCSTARIASATSSNRATTSTTPLLTRWKY
jgi:hypothetical protein